jgi:hypothetical protein
MNYREVLTAVLITWVVMSSVFHSTSANVLMDAQCFYDAAVRHTTGSLMYPPPSAPELFFYLPTIPLMMEPFLKFDPHQIWKMWLAFNIFLLGVSGAVAACLSVGKNKTTFTVYCAILALIFHNWAFTAEAFGANCEMLLALDFALMLVSIRCKNYYAFAVCVAIGACFKIWMIGLVGYLLINRKFKESLLCVILFACAVMVMFQYVGWSQFEPFVRLNRLYSERKIGSDILMHSINSFGDIHFKANKFVKPLIDNEKIRSIFVGLLDCSVAVALISVLFRKRESADGSEEFTKLCFFMSSMFLLMPVFHLSYVVVVLPGLAWLIFGNQRIPVFTKIGCGLLYVLLTRIQVFEQYGLAHGTENAVAGLLASASFFWLLGFWMLLLVTLISMKSQKSKTIATQK